MMEGTWRRGLLAAVVGLGVWAGLARSEEQILAPSEMPKPPAPPITRWFQRHHCCCASHHNDLGCTSGKADFMFIFGSCRTFYLEPCPQGPTPYRYAPPKATNPGSPTPGGCGCQ
jgi:hypothetical protein